MKTKHDDDFLRAALAGYEQQARDICAKMEAIRQQIRGRGNPPVKAAAALTVPVVGQKRQMSAEGRERIAAAQRRRWAKTKRAAA